MLTFFVSLSLANTLNYYYGNGIFDRKSKTNRIEAEKIAAKTLAEVKSAMKINYFDDVDLIQEQAKRFAEK